MAAYRLPHDGTRECDAADLALTVARRRRVLAAQQPAGAPRPDGRRGRVRPAAAGRCAVAGLAGREDVRRRRGRRDRGGRRRGAGAVRRGGPDARRRWSAHRPSWSASGWTGSRTVGGPRRRTVPLRRAVRRPAARADRRAARSRRHAPRRYRRSPRPRLRPDNRAVLVYEPTEPTEAAESAESAEPTAADDNDENEEPAVSDATPQNGEHVRSVGRNDGVPPAARTAAQPKPWAFPAPERGTLDNGLTVLRCHRPGQQVVAVEVSLDAPLDAEPRASTASPRSWRARSPRAPTSTTRRSSPPSWSAAAPPWTRTPTTPACASRWRSPPPG